MASQAVSVDINVIVPVVLSVLAPAVTGFLQQWNKKFSETAPWYLKGAVNSAVAALIGLITSYAVSGDLLLSSAAGAVVGVLGTVGIAFRKGSRGNLEIEFQKEAEKLSMPPGAPVN